MSPSIHRLLDIAALLEEKSYFLFGPRQTGKTTLVNSLLSQYRFINLLKNSDFQRYSTNPSLLREEVQAEDRIVVIDEIQLIPELLNEVQVLIEEKKVHFLLTGSSARKLRRGGVNLLGGRARTRYFHPFVYRELLEHFNLERALFHGLIPSIYFSTAVDEDLDAYIGNYLQQEIMAEGLCRNLQSFSRVLEVAALCHGEQINYASIASDAQAARSTVQNYFDILKDTLIIHELPIWNKTRKRKAQSMAKFYFFDFGIVRRMRRYTTIPPKSEIFGIAFESFIFHEIKTFCDYNGIADLHYWRSQNKDEVDFIIDNRIAVEVKSTSLVQDKHLSGIRRLKDEKMLEKYLVVSMDEHPRRPLIDTDIEILPWRVFLDRLWNKEI